jgi:hypothetical protein
VLVKQSKISISNLDKIDCLIQVWIFFLPIMSGSVLSHRQRSPEDVRQLLAWYKIRDTLLQHNCFEKEIKEALELASVCEHPNAVWLTKVFDGCAITEEEVQLVFLGCENDPRAICFAGLLGGRVDEIRRAADLGDAFAQTNMAWRTNCQERFR